MPYKRRKKFLGLGGRRRKSRFKIDDFDWEKSFGSRWNISEETKKGIFIILLFVLAALSVLGLFALSGEFGQAVVKILAWLFGGLKWMFPIGAVLLGYFLLREGKYRVRAVNYIGVVFLILGLTALWHLRFTLDESLPIAKAGLGGGYVGVILSYVLLKLMSFWGALVVCLAVFLIGLLLAFETSLYGLMWPIKLFKFLGRQIKELYLLFKYQTYNQSGKGEPEGYEEEIATETDAKAAIEVDDTAEEKEEVQFEKKMVGAGSSDDAEMSAIAKPKKFGKKIELPLSLLVGRSGKPTSGDIKANQEIIKKTLANFGMEVEMGEVNVGPTVTQYTLRPADGVKLSKIINLNSDLALALAAHPIRIEAPIPGRSLVGVEIPNKLAAKVTMSEMLISKEFKERKDNIFIAMGLDVSGRPYLADLARMPHLLIAGATGSGKSVCINAIIVSLLYQNNPDELKFILVDPKRVELPIYDGIPYLLTPVITDVKKTINALKWTVVEMERRFEVLAKAHKRNIEAYNHDAADKIPYLVLIIDELADLMSAAPAEVEGGIVRLAQMSRAVGIHLILATQRPSVEVITGLIKANIPARVAFAVASSIDSRTILDTSGAEKLIGRGDMLYLGPDIAKSKRLQGVYLSDIEIKNVVDYIKNQGEADYVADVVERQSVGSFASGGFSDDGDSLLSEAKEIIGQAGKASASLLQRRLSIGYARAARILDLLEQQGIIGPSDGAKPREVFLDKLGGVSAVEFAAREHDLAGELRPFSGEEDGVAGGVVLNEKNDEETAEEEEESDAQEEWEEAMKAEEVVEAEEVEKEKEGEVEEIEAVEETPAVKSKKTFDEDEWT